MILTKARVSPGSLRKRKAYNQSILAHERGHPSSFSKSTDRAFPFQGCVGYGNDIGLCTTRIGN
jgi:hypothetical protein